MKVLVFDTYISGHHLEYIHHIYSHIDSNDEYCFAVPEQFNDVKNKLHWSQKNNTSFDYIDSKSINKAHNSGHLLQSLRLSIILSRYVKKHRPDRVFLVSMIDYFPLLPFIMRNKAKVSGIIYKIYLYEWHDYSLFEKIYETIRIASISRNSNAVFVLNDEVASVYLNKLWHVKCFKHLVDPYVPIDKSNLCDVRTKLNIPHNVKLFCHLGSLDERKGTLEILKAIKIVEEQSFIYVVFAGKIGAGIYEQFYNLYNNLKYKNRIIIINEFCSYDFLGSIVNASDCILLPYKRTSLSSGFIYYALQFGKNVIGSAGGLLGKLIRKYKLGSPLYHVTPQDIAESIISFETTSVPYVDLNQVHPSVFAKQILKGII